jgi:hypothetical protein
VKILVTGSRNLPPSKFKAVEALLQGLYENHSYGYGTLYMDPFFVVHGCAPGADHAAHVWASIPGPHPGDIEDMTGPCPVREVKFPADWNKYGKRAGYIRNSEMIAYGPDLVLAFFYLERTQGTAMTVKLAKDAGIEVWEMLL